MRVDICKVDSHLVLFGANHVGPKMIIEFDYCIRITQSRCTMRDIVHITFRIDLAKWIATKIAELGTNAP